MKVWGYIIGGLCIVAGVLLLAIAYPRYQSDGALPPQRPEDDAELQSFYGLADRIVKSGDLSRLYSRLENVYRSACATKENENLAKYGFANALNDYVIQRDNKQDPEMRVVLEALVLQASQREPFDKLGGTRRDALVSIYSVLPASSAPHKPQQQLSGLADSMLQLEKDLKKARTWHLTAC